MADRRLIPRVQQYMDVNKSTSTFDTLKMARDLQRQYGEYARKKQQPFKRAVEEAFNKIIASGCVQATLSSEMKTNTKRRGRKRKLNDESNLGQDGKSVDDEEVESDSSFSSNNDDYVEHKDLNSMNSFLTGLYKNTSSKNSCSTLPCDVLIAAATTSSSPLGRPSSPCSFVIDRTGSKPLLMSNDTMSNGIASAVLTLRRKACESLVCNVGSVKPVSVIEDAASVEKRSSENDVILVEEGECSRADDCLSSVPTKKAKLSPPDPVSLSASETKTAQSGTKITGRQSNRTSKRAPRSGMMESSDTSQTESFVLQKSSVTFDDIGGMLREQLEISILMSNFGHPELMRLMNLSRVNGILIHGAAGCGKTLLANAIAGQFSLPILNLSATEIVTGVSGESEGKIRDVFRAAVANAPCILFIDNIHVITQKRESSSKAMEKRIVAELNRCMDDLNRSSEVEGQVLVIGATNCVDTVDTSIRDNGRFSEEIPIGLPDEKTRICILKVLCRNLTVEKDLDFCWLARITPGFVGNDLKAMISKAAHTAIRRLYRHKVNAVSLPVDPESCESVSNSLEQDDEAHLRTLLKQELEMVKQKLTLTADDLQAMTVTREDFESAAKLIKPSAKREGFSTVPDVTWADIGALGDIRSELHSKIVNQIQYPVSNALLEVEKSSGVLLIGPPGCGKTLVAKAIANEAGLNFISVKGPELLNMYVGESERAVREVFQRARNSAPCVIFFDELDALCPARGGGGDNGLSSRVVAQMLTEMDGFEDRKQIFLLGASNRPDVIDAAILRPGRFDKLVYIGLPSAEGRVEILKTITKNIKPLMSPDVDLDAIAKDARCNGMTGADLSALVKEVKEFTLKECISAVQGSYTNSSSAADLAIAAALRKGAITLRCFNAVLNKLRPSVKPQDQVMYEKMRKLYCVDINPTETD